jgi:hypothetical protein
MFKIQRIKTFSRYLGEGRQSSSLICNFCNYCCFQFRIWDIRSFELVSSFEFRISSLTQAVYYGSN